MRQPATIGALSLVVIGVVLGATVFRTEIAQATGLVDKPQVTVVNTAANPVPANITNTAVPTRATDNPAFQPFRVDLLTNETESFQVPANKRLVIQEVTGRVSAAGDHRSDGAIVRLDIPGKRPLFFASDGYWYRSSVPDTNFVVTEQATVYVEPGTTVSMFLIVGGGEIVGGEMTVIGYLVNV
jgi:hypothetical protein